MTGGTKTLDTGIVESGVCCGTSLGDKGKVSVPPRFSYFFERGPESRSLTVSDLSLDPDSDDGNRQRGRRRFGPKGLSVATPDGGSRATNRSRRPRTFEWG